MSVFDKPCWSNGLFLFHVKTFKRLNKPQKDGLKTGNDFIELYEADR